MFRFSIRAALGLMLATALVCTVLFAVPNSIFVAILFIGVIALPAPLAVGVLHNRRWFRTFSRGGLVAYGIWFVIAGIPCGYQAMSHFGPYVGVPFSGIGTSYGARTGTALLVPSYLVWVGLYAPWFVVPAGGLLAMLTEFVAEKPSKPDVK